LYARAIKLKGTESCIVSKLNAYIYLTAILMLKPGASRNAIQKFSRLKKATLTNMTILDGNGYFKKA